MSNALTRHTRKKRGQGYATFVSWVRKTHSWIGLWGALLGLVFGLSGIWLNHRAVLKLPPMAQQRGTIQIALPSPPPASPEEMRDWLMQTLERSEPPNSTRVEASRPLPWANKGAAFSKARAEEQTPATLMQPARWLYSFGGPNELVQAEYWSGNQSVSVTTTSNGFLATLTNLHKGVGMTTAWILLIDTLAGCMIFLSISGVILWIQLNRRRAVGFGIFAASIATTAALVGIRL